MNISFKAHFTNNANLHKLINESKGNRYLAWDCKNSLSKMPPQELMISNISGERGGYSIEVVNCNNGQKTTERINEWEPLVPLIKQLARHRFGSKFFDDNLSKYQDIVSILINPKL